MCLKWWQLSPLPLLLRNSRYFSQQLFQSEQLKGPFQWVELWPQHLWPSRQPMTSGHIIPQKYNNSHQSFGAQSCFLSRRKIVNFPAKCSTHRTTNTKLCLRSRVRNCILEESEARKAETWAVAARHGQQIHAGNQFYTILKTLLQANSINLCLFSRLIKQFSISAFTCLWHFFLCIWSIVHILFSEAGNP